MACYSNETKHKCSKVVLIIGIAAFVVGILVAVFGAMQMGAGKEYTAEYANIDVEGGFSMGTIIGGILCIITGVLGCLTGKFKKPFFTIPFMALAIIIAIFLLVAAAIMGGGEDTVKDVIAQACTYKNKDFGDKSTRDLFKGQYEELVDL
jgi:hypothetical protein